MFCARGQNEAIIALFHWCSTYLIILCAHSFMSVRKNILIYVFLNRGHRCSGGSSLLFLTRSCFVEILICVLECECLLFQDKCKVWVERVWWDWPNEAKSSQVKPQHLRCFGLETNVLDIFCLNNVCVVSVWIFGSFILHVTNEQVMI